MPVSFTAPIRYDPIMIGWPYNPMIVVRNGKTIRHASCYGFVMGIWGAEGEISIE
jgi:hypothetical protein